jgi:ABC-type transporter Mla subunit MlaD
MNEEREPTSRGAERVVGIFVVVALLLLVAGFGYYLYRTAERQGWRVPRAPYYTFAESGEGLNVGDPVFLMGFEVGEVTLITAQPPGSWYKVYVGFDIKRPYYGYVWSDSKVRIAASGLLGQRRLELTAGQAGAPTVYEKDGRISELLVGGQREPYRPEGKRVYVEPLEELALTVRAEKLLSQVEAALPNILAVTNRLNVVLDHSAALTSNANQLVADIRPAVTSLATRVDATLVSANTNLDVLAANLNTTLLNLADITGNLNSQVQSNDQILAEISRLVVDADDLVQGLKRHWLIRGLFPKTNAPSAGGRSK